jgi:hypothetical protein
LPAGVAVVPSTLGNRAELTGAVFLAVDHGEENVSLSGKAGQASLAAVEVEAADEPVSARARASSRRS